MVKFLIAIVGIFLSIHISNQTNEEMKVSKLFVNNSDIKQVLLNNTYEANQSLYSLDKSVMVLRVSEFFEKEKYEFRTAMVYKSDFNWYLEDTSDSLFGFFNYQDLIVLVFGDASKHFFTKTGYSKEIEFLHNRSEQNQIPEEIEKPPMIFEPEVWVYIYDSYNKEFSLQKKGMLGLLE